MSSVWERISCLNTAVPAQKHYMLEGMWKAALASGFCFFAFSISAMAQPLPIQEANCQLHAMAAYPQPESVWQIDSQPYGGSFLRKTAAGPFQIMTQQGAIETEQVAPFDRAQDLLRAIGLNERTPPAWRSVMLDASENVAALDAFKFHDGDFIPEMVLVRIDEPAPKADLPGGAILGAMRLINQEAEGERLYAQLWATECFEPG